MTGSAGFIGNAALKRLSDGGAEVHGLTRAIHDWARPATDELFALLGSPDAVVHAAFTPPRPDTDPEDLKQLFDANLRAARHCAQAAQKASTSVITVISSGSVYLPNDRIISENSPLDTESPYSLALQSMEKTFWTQAGPRADIRIMRIFYPYGPGQPEHRLIPRLAAKIKRGDPITLPVRGEATDGAEGPRVSPVFIGDVADAVATLTALPPREGARRIFNIGGPEIISIRRLSLLIARELGVRSDQVLFEAVDTPIENRVSQSTTLAKLTGKRPTVNLQTGLHSALKSYT